MLKYTDLKINGFVTVRIWKGHETRTKVTEKYNSRGRYCSEWYVLATIYYNNPADPNGRCIRVVPYDCTKCSYTHTLSTVDSVTGMTVSIDRYLLKREVIIRKAIKKAYSTGDGSVLHGISEELTCKEE